jgi:hypothetical protein
VENTIEVKKRVLGLTATGDILKKHKRREKPV